jgi:hypothetical protein
MNPDCKWSQDEPCDLAEAYGFECPGEITEDNPDGCPDFELVKDEYDCDDCSECKGWCDEDDN